MKPGDGSEVESIGYKGLGLKLAAWTWLELYNLLRIWHDAYPGVECSCTSCQLGCVFSMLSRSCASWLHHLEDQRQWLLVGMLTRCHLEPMQSSGHGRFQPTKVLLAHRAIIVLTIYAFASPKMFRKSQRQLTVLPSAWKPPRSTLRSTLVPQPMMWETTSYLKVLGYG